MIKATTKGMERLNRVLAILGSQPSPDLVAAVGATVESQVRNRIQNEKSDPEGEPWKAWSDAYAKTRKAGQSLLQSEGGLLDSIEPLTKGNAAEVGSALIYANRHQKTRPYLGLSDENERDLLLAIGDHLEREVMRA